VLTGIMQRADDIGTTFTAALIADDDDGNLGNDTPNYCTIERAFGSHGLVPDYVTTRVSAPVVNGLDIALTVDAPAATKCALPTVTNITVTWRAGDSVPSSFDLVPEGSTWRGTFPDQPDGTVITYAIDVVYDDGAVQVFPNNPADPRYQLFVGAAVPMYCTSFDDDPQWPQTSNAGPEWQWGVPAPGARGGDPTTAFSGTNVLGTDVKGDGLYRSNVTVSTSTPLLDTTKYQRVRLQYWRWLTVEDGVYDQATITAHGTVIWRNALSQTGTLDHVDREWRFHDIDITSYVDRYENNVQVSWHLTSDFGKELGGWTLDDVCIVGQVKNAACGDAEVDLGERCDDGNTVNGDGCDDECQEELVAGGGGCCAAGSATPSYWLCFVVLVLVRRRRCSSN
jgi:cysteine-rich repeat protein